MVEQFFSAIPGIPPDPIFNLTASYNTDTHPNKINVGVGAYRDDGCQPWVLPVVDKASKLVVEDKKADHEYLPIEGLKSFTEASAKFALGSDSAAIKDGRVAAIQSISGTGALRLGGEFLRKFLPEGTTIYVSNPSWIIHKTMFEIVGFKVKEYPYWHPQRLGLDIQGMISAIREAPNKSIFILHACAHNPTGCDPTPEQWNEILKELRNKNHFPFIDSAYQGFASGDVAKDSAVIRLFEREGLEFFVAQSYSKNFGLYNERVGCLLAVSHSQQEAMNVKSQLCRIVRNMYSNPPAFGARVVSKILNSPELYTEWNGNLQTMVSRIQSMRKQLLGHLTNLKTPGNWEHIVSQIGMFSFTGLNTKQSLTMKEKFHIYMTDNGRISMAGLNNANLLYFAESLDWTVRNIQ